jgi:predicted nucleic acid-binding protein
MSRYLLDTNVLLRVADIGDKDHLTASNAVATLIRNGDELFIATQNIIEFWAIGTRPANVNGVGWDPSRVAEVASFLAQFPLLEERPNILETWLDLVSRYRVSGKTVHDARLVALMLIHGVSNVLTFNVADFVRYSEIQPLPPSNILSQKNP